ncbi:MAG: ScaI family restriction endonuclease [Bacteroidales bacterium]|nr:ScaI family restriction endonuclease [Bacteroidales bacterium]
MNLTKKSNMESPYQNLSEKEWLDKTKDLIDKHPLKNEIKDIVLKSWDDIFNSKIGPFTIGEDIFPSPQILSFFLHELVAHNLSLRYPDRYKVGELKNEKDVHDKKDPSMGIEIKASSNPKHIFANRSYAQPSSNSETKEKNGYYITINFEKISKMNPHPKITLIRFGYLEHEDWIAQKSATGQQARLRPEAYSSKLIEIYKS